MRERLHGGRLVWLLGPVGNGVPPNLNLVWGVPEAQGYSSLNIHAAAAFVGMEDSAVVTTVDDAAFDLADVQFVAAPKAAARVLPANAPVGAAG
jgi:hypothetical protein